MPDAGDRYTEFAGWRAWSVVLTAVLCYRNKYNIFDISLHTGRINVKRESAIRAVLALTAVLLTFRYNVKPVLAASEIRSITVVCDDNYPPYVFRESDGKLHGIVVDQWKKWSEKTGIAVSLNGMDWNKAQIIMKNGNADVIDTMFLTAERSRLYDFTPSYASIEVPVFFSSEISGISDLKSLYGFVIAVKQGDACIEMLRKNGVEILIQYPDYQAMIDDAAKGKVKVFCMDKPPALYLLNKEGIRNRFRMAESIYTGQFRRAVKKGSTALLETVNGGFAKITKNEYVEIDRRWKGETLGSLEFVPYFAAAVVAAAVILLVLFLWNVVLLNMVKARTADLNEAMNKVQKSEKKFHAIFDSSLQFFGLLDADGRMIEANATSLKAAGIAIEDVRGAYFWDTPWWEHSAEEIEKLKNAFNAVRNGVAARYETTNKISGGGIIYVDFSLKPIFDETGRVVLMIPEGRDITKKIEGEKKLARSVEQLQRSNAELANIAYVTSHDMQGPLRTILCFSGIIVKRYKDAFDADAKECFAYIMEASSMMKNLINDLLDYSRLEGTAAKNDVVIGEVVNGCVSVLSAQIGEKNAVIEVGEMPVLNTVKTYIQQTFLNLISNALKFSRPGMAPKISVESKRGRNEWVFCVKDNGIGIDKKYLPKIFELFERLHTSSEYEGTGIGLAICKKVMQKTGGRIWAESEPGKGSAFYFTVPDDSGEKT
jgi:PAS domain S-box-containing protein